MARALTPHNRQHGAGNVHRPNEAYRQLRLDLRQRQVLKVPGVKVPGVIDEHVDTAEALDGGLDGGRGVGAARDVELDDEQIGRFATASATASGLRPVATTALPAASAAPAMSVPMPRPAPVMNQTFFSVMCCKPFLSLCLLRVAVRFSR